MALQQQVTVDGVTYSEVSAKQWLSDHQLYFTQLEQNDADEYEKSLAYSKIIYYQNILNQIT